MFSENLVKLLNDLRVIPRAMLFTYMIVFYETVTWFMQLPEPNNAQSAFVSVVTGAGAAWFGLYVNSGGEK